MMWVVLTLGLVSSSMLPCQALFTDSQLSQIQAELATLFNETRSTDGQHFTLAHKAVRLSFHDCVGGCNGCLNTDNPENAGLAETIGQLNTFYHTPGVVDGMKISELGDFSQADLWALAGTTALEFLSTCPKRNRPCTGFTVPFKYGRADCATSPTTTETLVFPNAHGDHGSITGFFLTEFGFSDRETIALLGAHTIGRASRTNSGFAGRWVDKWDTVDNAYYTDLADAARNWTQRDINAGRRNADPKWQWNENGNNMMLNADMCLYKDITVSEGGGESSCTYSECDPSPGATDVEVFAADNDLWLAEFKAVFVKMVEHVGAGVTLQDVAPSVATRRNLVEKEERALLRFLLRDVWSQN